MFVHSGYFHITFNVVIQVVNEIFINIVNSNDDIFAVVVGVTFGDGSQMVEDHAHLSHRSFSW